MRLWKPIQRGDCELDDMYTLLDQRGFKHAQDKSQHRKPLSFAGLQQLDVQGHQIRVRDVFFVCSAVMATTPYLSAFHIIHLYRVKI